MSVLGRLLGRPDEAALVIEPMRRRDISGVLRIERTAYPKPWTENIFRNELEMMARGERTYLVARRGAAVVGYAGILFAVDESHVTNIAVSGEERRSGLATRLLADLLHDARRRGCVGVTLEVRRSNHAAQALYERFGFAEAGVRKNYYENSEDALVMWLHELQSESVASRLVGLCPEAGR